MNQEIDSDLISQAAQMAQFGPMPNPESPIGHQFDSLAPPSATSEAEDSAPPPSEKPKEPEKKSDSLERGIQEAMLREFKEDLKPDTLYESLKQSPETSPTMEGQAKQKIRGPFNGIPPVQERTPEAEDQIKESIKEYLAQKAEQVQQMTQSGGLSAKSTPTSSQSTTPSSENEKPPKTPPLPETKLNGETSNPWWTDRRLDFYEAIRAEGRRSPRVIRPVWTAIRSFGGLNRGFLPPHLRMAITTGAITIFDDREKIRPWIQLCEQLSHPPGPGRLATLIAVHSAISSLLEASK